MHREVKTTFEENTGKEKGALEKLNEIGMELQEMEESMAFMDEYAQKFYKMAREDEKSFRREMRRQAQKDTLPYYNDIFPAWQAKFFYLFFMDCLFKGRQSLLECSVQKCHSPVSELLIMIGNGMLTSLTICHSYASAK